MGPVIRAAQIAYPRKRLTQAFVQQPDRKSGLSAAGSSGIEQTDTLRSEIERQVRAELQRGLDELRDSERARARTEGLAAGLEEGSAAAASELARTCEDLATRANRVLSALEQAHRGVLSKLESGAGEVAFAAVCQLVGRQAATRPFVLGLVEQICRQLRTDSIAMARMHPRDIDTLRELLQDGELRIHSLGLEVVPDESLELGGCVVEAASGRYDGALEGQLRRLHAVLTDPRVQEIKK